MSTISLSFYEITFRIKRKKQLKELDHLEGKEKDLLKSVYEFFSDLPAFKPDLVPTRKQVSKSLFIERLDSIRHRQISGTVRTGDDGFGSEFFDGKSGKREFTRKTTHVELMPFYFLFDLPPQSKKAILAVQSFAVYGMGIKMRLQLLQHLRLHYPDYVVNINVILVGGLYIDKYIRDGELVEIEATRYVKKGDFASDYAEGIKCEYHISPVKKTRDFGEPIKKLLKKAQHNNKANLHTIYKEVSHLLSVGIPDDIDNMRFEISLDGRRRKIDLSDITKCATKFDITGEVTTIAATGHPEFTSIDRIAKNMTKNDIRNLIQ